MSIANTIGFVVVCGAVAVGVDVYTQSKAAEGPFGASEYFQTLNDRYAGFLADRQIAKAESDRQDRWAAGGQGFMPAPPEGWASYSFAQYDEAPVIKALSFNPAPVANTLSTTDLYTAERSGNAAKARILDRTGRVYSGTGPNGVETLWLDITFKPKAQRNTMAGLAMGNMMAFTNGMEQTEGYAVFDGVGFVEVSRSMLNQTDEPLGYRNLVGRIGFDEEVVIRLRTDASDDTIRQFLGSLDYAALNAVLKHPVSAVGAGYVLAANQQAERAEQMNDLYRKASNMQTKISMEKIENMDMGALMVNTFASGFGQDGVVDITGGAVFENQDLLQIGYGNAVSSLFEADRRQADAAPTSEASDTQHAAVAPSEDKPGFLSGLLDSLPSLGGTQVAGEQSAAQPVEVRVNKGGFSGSNCVMQGAVKRCKIGQN
ncbi:hypothetical protein J7426_01780 [Tropicibacter sp. R16_0]|uniref:hypothetical protein n=1 Tax=Tropicibacter sp. R16_0 TaxID=2821102 RepID=UPI001ADB564E|nr:hypothetical protein [Tropicibacter sp. R16_0]MBO9448967.1 hypothetical protein [Tropicibacter sp. R16_0]